MARRKFDKQFKKAAVKFILEEGYSVKEVSLELDVHGNSLYRCVQEVEEYGENAFPGNGTALADAQHKIKLLEKENRYLHEHKGRYGAVRITKVLHNSGVLTNPKRVGKLMHLMGLYAKGSRYKYKHYNRKGASLSRPNLINQIFKATAPNKVWLGDMTYIPTKEGTLYLAVNIDVFSRKIVGWSMSSRMQDKLIMDCFLQACGKE